MQPSQTSKTIVQGLKPTLSGNVSKSKANLSKTSDMSGGRTKNTSGGDSGTHTGGGRTVVIWDGKNMTPKSLVPSTYQKLEANAAVGTSDSRTTNSAAVQTAGDFTDGETTEQISTATGWQQSHQKDAKPVLKQALGLTKEELERPVDIILAETETQTLLYFPSLCVALESDKSSIIVSRNKFYDELCAGKADSDKFREQHTQSMNQPHKSKEVFAAPLSQESVEVSANRWDIYDTFATASMPKHEQIQQSCEKESAATVALAVKKPGCLFTMSEPYPQSDLSVLRQVSKAVKGKDDNKRAITLKSGNSAVRAAASGLAGGPSKNLGAAASTDIAEAQGLASGNTGSAGVETTMEASAEAGEVGSLTDLLEPSKTPQPVDQIPWMIGAENPIPEELGKALRVMERIVSQNVFHKQHMIYRNYPTLEELARLDEQRMEQGHLTVISETSRADVIGAGLEIDGEEAAEEAGNVSADDAKDSEKPSLQDLFCFDAPQLTQGMTVTCAGWNRHNQDLLAVSYGDTAPVANTAGGLVLFWSLKNPTYPERVIRTRHGVTALHFSNVHPNMVAAGTHDGSVMIWDLRKPFETPVLKSGSSVSQHNDQKHTDTVWETRWVDQGPEKQPPELLVTVSSDGNVLQWSLKKGLEQMQLMQLKRLPNPLLGANSVYGHKEGIVFRKSSGFCVDFPRHDRSTYLVGTEDGLVHRCSTSYNEYLDTYYGHSGPVYKVRCNPFMSQAFLTCSADWTMKLWTTKPVAGQQPDAPLLTLQSTDLSDAVNDVVWAPQNSTSFAAAMDDGRVELWDLSEKPLDPIVVHYPGSGKATGKRPRRTCVRFSPNSPVLVAGDDRGSVDVMRMYNTNQLYYSDQEQQDRLEAVMVKKR